MSDQHDSLHVAEPLDELVTKLLDCGAVLSQIVTRMVEYQAAGRPAPDAAPIPEVAHSLISGVLGDVRKRYSKRDIRVAAAIVALATDAMVDNIFYLGPALN